MKEGGKSHGWRVKELLLLTAPMERNNRVRVMDVVWPEKEDQQNTIRG